jgi:CubicO group peptidase (beta-lactamase class C family)
MFHSIAIPCASIALWLRRCRLRGRFVWLAAVQIVVLSTDPARAQSADDDGTVIEGTLGVRLDAAVMKLGRGEFWGSVLVAKDGRILLAKGYGLADLKEVPNTPRMLFDIGSASKQFTAAAILKLEMQGRLNTDDSIARHLAAVPEDKTAITIHHLLTHTSGLPAQISFDEVNLMNRDEMVAGAMQAKLRSAPGEEFQYSNAGYSLLAAIIERASGQSFESYVKQQVFVPAGMVDTAFLQDPQLNRSRETERVLRPGKEPLTSRVGYYAWSWGFRGATGVVTTPCELYAWDQALRGDKVLSEKAREKFIRPFKAGYAYGWMVEETPRGTRKIHHGGSTLGYTAKISRYVDENAVVIITTNSQGDVHGLDEQLASVLFRVKDGIDSQVLARYSGVYELSSKDSFDLAVEDEQLVVRSLGPEATCRLLYGCKELPEWPGLYERVAEKGLELIRPLTRGDSNKFRCSFDPTAPAENVARSIEQWQDCLDTLGEFESGFVLGTQSRADGMTTHFRVVFGGTPVTFQAEWGKGQFLSSFVRIDRLFPYQVTLTPRSRTEFAAKSLNGAALIRVVFNADANEQPTSLVWHNGSQNAAAGILCKRIP